MTPPSILVSSVRNVGILWNASLHMFSFDSRLLGYEGVEVINPDGGKEDAEEEAQRGRWKPEVHILPVYFVNVIFAVPTFFSITLFFTSWLDIENAHGCHSYVYLKLSICLAF